MRRLNLGCGHDYKPGWVNLDRDPRCGADVAHDLDDLPYPFADGEFEYVYASHVLEHVEDLFATLAEIERVLEPGGTLHVRVPHFSNGNGYNDLTHRRFFGWFTFDAIAEGIHGHASRLEIERRRLNFLAEQHAFVNRLVSPFFNLLPKRLYERFLCWILPVGEVEVWLRRVE